MHLKAKLSKKLRNGSFEVMDQNSLNIVLINNSRTIWSTYIFKILMPFFSSLKKFIVAYLLFFKKVLKILRYSTKHANFWLGV